MATQEELASHLFMSSRWLREYIKKGILPASKGRGGYDLDKCREAYIVYLSGVKNGKVQSHSEEEPAEVRDANIKRKTLETKLRKENYQLSVLEKKYGPIKIITVTLQRVSQSWTIRLESFSARIKRAWPDMPDAAKDVIDTVIAEGANELANMRPDLSDYRESDHDGGEQWAETLEDGET